MLMSKKILNWMKKNVTQRSASTKRRRRNSSVAVERLEERTVLTTMYAVDTLNNLLTFDSATPGTIISTKAITGLGGTEVISGIDVRPATGQLYGLGIIDDGGTRTGRVWVIDTSVGGSAPATAAGAAFSAALSDTDHWGFDFNPTVDRIRIVNDFEQNLRVNPNDGAIVVPPGTFDTNLITGGNIMAAAYDRNGGTATMTTLFAIDFNTDDLVRIGGIDGSPSPNLGAVTFIGDTGIIASDTYNFDIEAGTGIARASAKTSGTTKLFTVNLVTGAFSAGVVIGAGVDLNGLTTVSTDLKVVGTSVVDNLVVTFTGPAAGSYTLANVNAGAAVPFSGITSFAFLGAGGNDTITVNGTAGADSLAVTATGTNAGSFSLGGGPGFSFTGINTFTVNGLAGNDTLTINNPALGLFAPAGGINYDGGTQTGAPGDSLSILGGAHTGETHTFLADGASGKNGTISLVGTATATYSYSNLSPVLVNAGTPATVVFNLLTGNGDDAVVLENDTPNVANVSRLRSGAGVPTFEQTDFVTPTTSLTINLGSDATESYFQQAVDAAFNTPNIAVNGGTGINTFNIAATPAGVATTLTGGAAQDFVNIGGANSLDSILGAVVFNDAAGAATDALNVFDQGDTTATNTYVLDVASGKTTIARTGAALITANSLVDNINVNAGTMTNTIGVRATLMGVTTTINGGAGQDTVSVGSMTNSLDAILGAVTFNDAVGVATDALNINDQGDASANTYTLGVVGPNGTIARGGAALITFNPLVNVVGVNGGTGVNNYSVLATLAGVATTLTGGAVLDTVNIGSAGNSLDNIAGPVTFNDAAGANVNDTLNINDQGDAGPNTYELNVVGSNGTISRTVTATGLITYNANVNVVAVKGGLGINNYQVLATPATAATTITGNAVLDTVNIGSATNSLDAILGAVTFNDDAGGNVTDELNIYDQGDANANTYALGSGTIARNSGAVISYNNKVDFVAVKGGTGVNTYNVIGSTTGVATTITGGAALDTVNIGGGTLATSLDFILGTVTFNDNAAANLTDALNILDQGDTTATNTYVFGSGTIARTGAALISYNADVNLVEVKGSLGVNTYNVVATPGTAATTLTGNTAQDIVNIGATSNSLDLLLGTVTFNDAAGANANDTLNILDSMDAGPNTYALNVSGGNGTILRSLTPAAALITYNANVNVVEVQGGLGVNTYNVLATLATAATTITGNLVLDTVNIGSATNSLDTILGAVTFNDGAGVITDVLNVLDQGDATANSYVLDVAAGKGTIARPSTGLISYNATVDLVNLNGGTLANTYGVRATLASAATTITGGAALDTVNIGSATDSLDAILGTVTFNDAAGVATDALNINDQGDASANNYVLDVVAGPNGTIARTGAALITYNALLNLVGVNGGTGVNTYSVLATLANVATTITGGAVQDTVSIGSAANSLDGILGAVTFNDAAGANANDTLNLNDQGDAGPNTYELNVASGNGTIVRSLTPAAAPITYNSNVNLVEVKGGLGVNTYNVLATPATAATTITGGAALDTVNVGSAGNSLDTILGGVIFNDNVAAFTTDALNIFDQGDADANNYTITSNTIDRDGAGAGTSITYNANVNILALNAGAGGNVINSAATGAGINVMTVNAGAGNDTINVNGPMLNLNSANGFNGEGDSDIFSVTPGLPTVAINVNGGLPTSPATPGDSLSINQTGLVGIVLTPPALPSGAGTYAATGRQTVNFTEIETLGTVLALPNTANTVRVSCVGTDLVVKIGSTVIFTGPAMTFFGELFLNGGTSADRITLESSLNACLPPTSKVTLNGNDGNDKLDASQVNLDVKMQGGAGNDVLLTGDGDDSVDGGAGNDVIKSGGGNDTLHGDAGNDGLDSGSGNDQAFGGEGNDVINGGSGNDLMFGEAGNDKLGSGSGNDIQVGGAGNDKLTGGSGGSLLIGGIGSDMITGGSADDILIAGNTDYDDVAVAGNLAALMGILAEWTSAVTTDYGARIDHLRGAPGGLNGLAVLTVPANSGTPTVHDDTPSLDALKGGSGRDWFFARTIPVKKDSVSGRVTSPIQLAEVLDQI